MIRDLRNEDQPAPVRALLLAGGLGTRLRPLTSHVPKCLVPIAGRPLLDYWIDRFEAAEVRDVRINTHHLPDTVRGYCALVNRTRDVCLTESFEPELLGSAGTVHANADLADGAGDCLIVYADNLSDVDLTELLSVHRAHDEPLTMMLFRTPSPEQCGIAELDAEGRIVGFTEKPSNPVSDLANGGVYAVTAEAFREIAARNAFDLAFDVLPSFVGRMRGWVWDGYHRDVGTPEALRRAGHDAPGVFFPPAEALYDVKAAVFLDRDGTIVELVHYLRDPGDVRVLPGAAQAVRDLQSAGYACVLVTNQAGIGRGLITHEEFEDVQREVVRHLDAQGVALDGTYYCAVASSSDDRTKIEHPDRKPGPGMLLTAARELGLDLARSWMVGDMISDVLAGENAGCRATVLLEAGAAGETNGAGRACSTYVADDLAAAARLILRLDRARRPGRSVTQSKEEA